MDDDYYKMLGVSRNASKSDIEQAYRKMAAKHHPDLADEDGKAKAKQRFQQIQKAHDVLSDPEKRELYDRYGSSFETMGGGGGGQHWQTGPGGGGGFDIDFSQVFGGRGGSGASPFEDIFRQFNQGGGQQTSTRARPTKGQDVTSTVRIPLQLSVEGGKRDVMVQRGIGKTETISFNVPVGIEDGKKIRLRGQGQPSPNGGQPGDLYVQVQVEPHPHFQRRGNDLIVKVPVTLAEAALGTKVDVPSPKGTIELKVPPATSSGRRLRVPGFGVKPAKGDAGDLYAEIQIQLPEELNDESKQLIQQFNEQTELDPRTDLKW